jgi:transcription initiation factor TFIIIB Brf1 subunit/transcription initiation factor TFIIB
MMDKIFENIECPQCHSNDFEEVEEGNPQAGEMCCQNCGRVITHEEAFDLQTKAFLHKEHMKKLKKKGLVR